MQGVKMFHIQRHYPRAWPRMFYEQTFYRSTIAGSFKNNSKNKKRKKYEIMKRDKQK